MTNGWTEKPYTTIANQSPHYGWILQLPGYSIDGELRLSPDGPDNIATRRTTPLPSLSNDRQPTSEERSGGMREAFLLLLTGRWRTVPESLQTNCDMHSIKAQCLLSCPPSVWSEWMSAACDKIPVQISNRKVWPEIPHSVRPLKALTARVLLAAGHIQSKHLLCW